MMRLARWIAEAPRWRIVLMCAGPSAVVFVLHPSWPQAITLVLVTWAGNRVARDAERIRQRDARNQAIREAGRNGGPVTVQSRAKETP